MRLAFCLPILALHFSAATINADNVDDAAKKYATKWKAYTKVQLPLLSQRLAMLKKAPVNRRLKVPFAENKKTGRFLFRSKKLKSDFIAATRSQMIALHDTGPAFPGRFPQAGEVGGLRGTKCGMRVLQVIDKGSVLAYLTIYNPRIAIRGKTIARASTSKVLFWMETDTKGLVDNSNVRTLPNRVFFVSGTKTYPTGDGGTDTVSVLTDITAKVMKLGPFSSITNDAELDAYLSQAKKRPTTSGDARAARALTAIRSLIKRGKKDVAKKHLERLIAKYPKTKAADEAKALLDGLK